jgi:hypothetical protein
MLRGPTTNHPDPTNVVASPSRHISTDRHLLLLFPSNVTSGRETADASIGTADKREYPRISLLFT